MARETGKKLIAQNKKARYDYSIEDVYEAGMVLTGTEVKSLRQGRASLVDGFAQYENGAIWLRQIHIPQYSMGTWTNHEPRRARKLLLRKDEIKRIDPGSTFSLLQRRLCESRDCRRPWAQEL